MNKVLAVILTLTSLAAQGAQQWIGNTGLTNDTPPVFTAKINTNFAELYNLALTNGLQQLGSSNATVKPVIASQSGGTNKVFSLEAGTNLLLSMTSTSIVVRALAGIGDNSVVAQGTNNQAYAAYSVVGGGSNNSNYSLEGVIGGGKNNLIETNKHSVIAGGHGNQIRGQSNADDGHVFIGGGEDNWCTNAAWGVIVGGRTNIILGTNGAKPFYATIGGGWEHLIARNASNAGINSGWKHTNLVQHSVIAGGWQNRIDYFPPSVDPELHNSANGIGAGYKNLIHGGEGCFIGAGWENEIKGVAGGNIAGGAILAGYRNKIRADYGGIILGGQENLVGDGVSGQLNGMVLHGTGNAVYAPGGGWIGHGNQNIVRGDHVILHGNQHEIRGGSANVILHGFANIITNGSYSTILNGNFCGLNGDYITLIGDALTTTESSTVQLGFANDTKTIQDANGLRLLGSLAIDVTNKTAAYTATAKDHVIVCDATGGAFTVTLPSASSRKGQVLVIKRTNSGANAVTVSRAGSDTIEDATTVSLGAKHAAVTVFSDGSATWMKYAPNQ